MFQITGLSASRRYAIAIGATAASTLLRWLIDPLVGRGGLPFMLSFLAFALAGWVGGFGPGLLSLVLNVVIIKLVWLAQADTGAAAQATNSVHLIAFISTGLLIILIASQSRRSQAKAEQTAARAARDHEWLRVTLMSIGDAVIVTDARGDVVLINPVAEDLTGWRPDQAVGLPLSEIYRLSDEETGVPVVDPVTRALRRGRMIGRTSSVLLTAQDGTRRPIDDSASPIRDDWGNVLGAVLVFRDVSRERHARDELRRALDLAEEASRAKDRFLAMLSHELRNPLTPVVLAADEMLRDPEMPRTHRESLEMIRQNVGLEVRLIDDLLDIMRIIRGKLPYRFERVDAHALVRRVAEICRGDVRDKQINLVVESLATEHHVQADPARLSQVLWNLIKNAVKFTPEGGTIRVQTESAQGLFRVAVSDTGMGIDPGALPRIFNAFEQAEDASTRHLGGLGLGLAISRSIAEAHGGTLVASSAGRGQGATFTLELNLANAVPASDHDGQPEIPSLDEHSDAASPFDPAGLRLLLVEDDPMTARVMARLLRHAGYQVTTAGSLAEARAVEIGQIDLIVSDLSLPDGTGLDFMREVRQHRDLPGIALTGYGRDDDIRRSQAAGFVAHLTKPIDFAQLETMIRRVASETYPNPQPEPAAS
ncbi:MAG: ATP-binding protein [Isosphaeraceae bacterium]